MESHPPGTFVVRGVVYQTETLIPASNCGDDETPLAPLSVLAEGKEAHAKHVGKKALTRKRTSRTSSSLRSGNITVSKKTLNRYDHDHDDYASGTDYGMEDPEPSSEPPPDNLGEEIKCLEALKKRRLNSGGAMRRPDASWIDEPPKSTDKDQTMSLWAPVMDEWTQSLLTLRQPTDPLRPKKEECFGCGYEQSKGPNTVYVQKWNNLLAFFTDLLHNHSSPAVIAFDLYQYFVRDMVAQMKADGYMDPNQELWSAYCIGYHFFCHNSDTFISAMHTITALQEMKRLLIREGVQKEHALSGRKKLSTKGLQQLKLVTDMELKMINLNPSKMVGTVQRRHVVPESVSFLTRSAGRTSARDITTTHNRWLG